MIELTWGLFKQPSSERKWAYGFKYIELYGADRPRGKINKLEPSFKGRARNGTGNQNGT